MSNRVPALARRFTLLLVVSSALGALGWLWWNSVRRSDINFLPRTSPAEWIIYPTPPQGVTHQRVELGTVFRCGFILDKAPARASLRVAGFHRYNVLLNGKAIDAPVRRGSNWKRPDHFDVPGQLVAGQNEIVVTVFNTNGPPALWLALETGTVRLVSSEAWEASLAGASWRNAQLAISPKPVIAGSQLYGGESAWACLRARWPTLLIFAALSAGASWLLRGRWRPVPALPNGERTARSAVLEILPVLGLAAMWVAVFANNLGALPVMYGYDVVAHMEYIRYILEHKSLPLANEGFEMFQPPLYYLLCAGLLKLLGLSVSQPAGIMALRILGFGIGAAHFFVVWACLRLLFPNDNAKAKWGVALAACLPPLLYLSQYISNEGLAAALVSASVWLALRMLKGRRVTWKQCIGLGVCLGAALLAKATALLVVPVILGALVWKGIQANPKSQTPDPKPCGWAIQAALVASVCVAVCGWHYGRTWLHFGSPFIAVWDPRLGYSYWQDEGYRTSAFYLRFGEALVHPWFSGLTSFADGIYTTLWGDGLLGGTALFSYRPPWNYDLMTVGYSLALGPACAVLAGGVLALRKFIREPVAEWFLVLGLGFLAAFAVVHMAMVAPSWCMVKAFYGLCALVPLCACGAWGLDFVWQRSGKLKAVLLMLFGIWGLNSCASFWISHSSDSSLLARAKSLREQGQYSQAAAALKQRLEVEPQSVGIRSLFADTLMRSGRQKEAVEQAEIVVKNTPEDANGHLLLAQLFLAEKRIGEAAEHAWKVVELAPGNGEAYQVLGKVLLRQERFPELARVSREGLGMDPFNAELRFGLGTALAVAGEGNEAVVQLELASKLKPNWAELHGVLGGMLTAQNRLDEAVVHFARAIRLDANNPVPHVDLGKVLAMQGKLKEATNHFHEALRLQPENAQAHLELATILEKQQGQQQ